MYRYIKGIVEELSDGYIVLENNGIGYYINTSKNTIYNLKKDNDIVKIYTHLHVREDDISIYGFYTVEELDMFNLLLTVSKIGPKVALGVLSTMNPSNIKFSILNNDDKSLSKCPGIGKKTASRMILELKDKVHIDENINEEDLVFNNSEEDFDEVIGALMSLGYTQSEGKQVLSKINKEKFSTEEIIKLALKELSK